MLKGGDLLTLRSCVENALEVTMTDAELHTKLTECLTEFPNDPYAAMQRGDTEEYNPEPETETEPEVTDGHNGFQEYTGGKKTRRRRHRHKSRRNRRKSHKRRSHKQK
jgi:hypothetical protein